METLGRSNSNSVPGEVCKPCGGLVKLGHDDDKHDDKHDDEHDDDYDEDDHDDETRQRRQRHDNDNESDDDTTQGLRLQDDFRALNRQRWSLDLPSELSKPG